MSTVPQERVDDRSAAWRLPWWWSAGVLALGLLWVAGVLVPYYVNGLDRLPAAELTSGAWDPAGLWPADTGPLGRAVQAAGALVGWPLLYVVHVASTLGSAVLLVQEWPTASRQERRLLLALATLSTCLTALLLSPFGIALSTWALD